MRSLLQGLMIGTIMHANQEFLSAAKVEQEMTDGAYNHYFDVVMASGKRYRVTVEEVEDGKG